MSATLSRRMFLASSGLAVASVTLPMIEGPQPDSFVGIDQKQRAYTFIRTDSGWICELYADDVYPSFPLDVSMEYVDKYDLQPGFTWGVIQHLNPDDHSKFVSEYGVGVWKYKSWSTWSKMDPSFWVTPHDKSGSSPFTGCLPPLL